MDAFDTDVLIFAASPSSPHGLALRTHLAATVAAHPTGRAGVGSVLLVTEALTKPTRHGHDAEASSLANLLARLDLFPCDLATAQLATDLGARYGLRTLDAVHLATAVSAGADRFVTNNRKDFSKDIEEIDITYPEDLDPTRNPADEPPA